MNFPVVVRATVDALASVPRAALPALLVVPVPLDAAGMAVLLAQEGIAGLVVMAESSPNIPSGAPVGAMDEGGGWSLPVTEARSLLVLTNHHAVFLRRSLAAWRIGITSMVILNARAEWCVVSLGVQLLRLLLAHSVDKVQGFLVLRLGLRNRILEWRLGALARRRPAVAPLDFVPKRILLASPSLSCGGAERQAVNTAVALARGGGDVAILCHYPCSEADEFVLCLDAPNVPIMRLRPLLKIKVSEPLAALRAIQTFLNRLDMENLPVMRPQWVTDDILSYVAEFLIRRPAVVHLWQDYVNVVGGLAAMLVGVPRIVLSMRNMAPHHFPYFLPVMTPIYRLLAQQPNVVMLNNSHAGATDYAAWLDIDPTRIRVLHNGVEELSKPPAMEIAAWRQRVGLAPDTRVVGGILRLSPEKDPLLWVETAAEVAKICPGVHFLLIGDGPMRDEVLHHAATLGLNSQLHMLEIVRDVRLPMAAMDVLLLSSRQEGLPNVLIEAQMLGCPVVTTWAGGSVEAVEHGRTGWVVPTRDPKVLAERLIQVLNDSEWCAQARTEAVSFARTRFGLRRMAEETRSVYDG